MSRILKIVKEPKQVKPIIETNDENNVIITKQDDEILHKEFNNIMSNRNGEKLSNNSIRSYKSKIQKISLLCNKKAYQNHTFLLNPEKVIQCINTHIKKSKKDYYSAIIKLLKNKNIDESIISQYSNEMKNQKTSEDTERGNNIVSKVHLDKLGNLDYETIKKTIIDYKPETKNDLKNQLICAFYFLNEFTPRNDLYNMKLRTSNNKKPVNPLNNYIIINKDKKALNIVMYNYKTMATYGKQIFSISSDLQKILDDYINELNKDAGEYLFIDTNGEPYTANNFNNYIHKAMQSILKSPLNIDLIRQYKLTNLFNTYPNMTINQRADMARNFLHSPTTALEYNRPAMINKNTDTKIQFY
jgi:hypothetical protein